MDGITSSTRYVWFALVLLVVALEVRRPADSGWTPIPCRRSFPCPEGRSEPPLPVDFVEAELRRQHVRQQLDAHREIERLYLELRDLDGRVTIAVDAVTATHTKADRDAAAVNLRRLRDWKLDIERRIRRVKVAAGHTPYRCGGSR